MSRFRCLLLFCLIAVAIALGIRYLHPTPPGPSAQDRTREALHDTPEVRTLVAAKDAMSHAIRLLDHDELRLQDHARDQQAGAASSTAGPQQHAAIRDDHLKQLGEACKTLHEFTGDERTKPLALAAIALGETVQQLAAVNQELVTTLDAGKHRDSPEAKALIEHAATLEASYQRQLQPLQEQLKAALIAAHASGLPSCGTR